MKSIKEYFTPGARRRTGTVVRDSSVAAEVGHGLPQLAAITASEVGPNGGSVPTTPNKYSSLNDCVGLRARSLSASPNPRRGLSAGDSGEPIGNKVPLLEPSLSAFLNPRRGLSAGVSGEPLSAEGSSSSPVSAPPRRGLSARTGARNKLPASGTGVRRKYRNKKRVQRRRDQQNSPSGNSGSSSSAKEEEQFERNLRKMRLEIAEKQVRSPHRKSPAQIRQEASVMVLNAERNVAEAAAAAVPVAASNVVDTVPLGTKRGPSAATVSVSALPAAEKRSKSQGGLYSAKAGAAKRFHIVKDAVGASVGDAEFKSVTDQLRKLILSPGTKTAVQLEGVHLSVGRINLLSKDKATEDWVRQNVPKLKGIGDGHPGYRFVGPGDLPPLHKVFVNLSTTEVEDKPTAMSYLRKQNPWINLERSFALGWYKDKHERYHTLVLGLDATAFQQLQRENMRMFCGLGSVKFKAKEKKRPRTVQRQHLSLPNDTTQLDVVEQDDAMSEGTASVASTLPLVEEPRQAAEEEITAPSTSACDYFSSLQQDVRESGQLSLSLRLPPPDPPNDGLPDDKSVPENWFEEKP